MKKSWKKIYHNKLKKEKEKKWKTNRNYKKTSNRK